MPRVHRSQALTALRLKPRSALLERLGVEGPGWNTECMAEGIGAVPKLKVGEIGERVLRYVVDLTVLSL